MQHVISKGSNKTAKLLITVYMLLMQAKALSESDLKHDLDFIFQNLSAAPFVLYTLVHVYSADNDLDLKLTLRKCQM